MYTKPHSILHCPNLPQEMSYKWQNSFRPIKEWLLKELSPPCPCCQVHTSPRGLANTCHAAIQAPWVSLLGTDMLVYAINWCMMKRSKIWNNFPCQELRCQSLWQSRKEDQKNQNLLVTMFTAAFISPKAYHVVHLLTGLNEIAGVDNYALHLVSPSTKQVSTVLYIVDIFLDC